MAISQKYALDLQTTHQISIFIPIQENPTVGAHILFSKKMYGTSEHIFLPKIKKLMDITKPDTTANIAFIMYKHSLSKTPIYSF